MKIGLPLKLGIGVIILFAIVIAVIMSFRFRWHASRLESENPEARQAAFEYLSAQNERGAKAIEDFCRRNTDEGWGKSSDILKMRIKSNRFVFFTKKREPDLGDIVLQVEVLNISGNVIQIPPMCRDFDCLEIITIAKDTSRNYANVAPKVTLTEEMPLLVTVPKKQRISITLSGDYLSNCGICTPGIYKISARFDPNYSFKGLNIKSYFGRKIIASNTICIAVLPAGAGN